MADLRELRNLFKVVVYGSKYPADKSEEWLVRQNDKAHDLLQNVRKLGYSGAFEMPLIRAFIRRKAVGHVFNKTVAGYRRVVDHMLSGHWKMESKVNPQNDIAVITARYVYG